MITRKDIDFILNKLIGKEITSDILYYEVYKLKKNRDSDISISFKILNSMSSKQQISIGIVSIGKYEKKIFLEKIKSSYIVKSVD